MKATKRTAKQASKPARKMSAKQAKKIVSKQTHSVLSHAERSAIARLAAYKAHTHKTFQSERSQPERAIAVALFKSASNSASAMPSANLRAKAKEIRADAE